MTTSGGNGRPNVIPLNVVERSGPSRRGETMRVAVVQAITDLFIERVPQKERSPFFEAAKDLVVQGGKTPAELIEVAEPGPQQEAFFEELGLDGGRE